MIQVLRKIENIFPDRIVSMGKAAIFAVPGVDL